MTSAETRVEALHGVELPPVGGIGWAASVVSLVLVGTGIVANVLSALLGVIGNG